MPWTPAPNLGIKDGEILVVTYLLDQSPVASKTKAGSGAARPTGPVHEIQAFTELTSFIQNSAPASHSDSWIIAELDFCCVYFLTL